LPRKRVYQIAREFKLSSEALLGILRDMGLTVKSHMSAVDDKTVEAVKDKLKEEKEAGKKEVARKKKIVEERKAEKKAEKKVEKKAEKKAGKKAAKTAEKKVEKKAKKAEKKAAKTATSGLVEVVDLKLAASVKDRAPVDPADTFASGTRTCTWVKLKVKEPETTIKLRYLLNDKPAWTSKPLTVKKSPSWRTWLYRKFKRAGDWKVEVLDANDQTVHTASFTVQ
jgi:outer membrane biosynthesis protein TonB